ncbi:ABC transporter permease [Methylovorus glucosotrophus]|uniref:Binding-protein-dependent transport systems inner membrane component n=1 Tax=Methylovorus glucosotrophus (strain SIP3-4) TaxID=582744 RepID=C6XCE0_METGS|nr:ABC transporter permease [Methylovorus glucosotrophus]ACT50215.1 binding-protein-dependent transport systems inner membrane component [Methylovorus glucosotrophus SIP3-4]
MKQLPALVILFWLAAVMLAAVVDLQPDHIHLEYILAAADQHAWLGYDDLGRNILARLLSGAGVSLLVVGAVTLITLSIGTVLGLLAGFYGGWLDRLLMRITDIFLAFPGMLLAIAFAAVLGPGLNNLLLALCMTSWVGYARLTRAQALSLRQRQHVQASEALGASPWRLMRHHMLPLLAAPLVVEATYSMAGLVIAEASLSFLGLGVQAPQASWGSMLRDGVRYLLVAPHYVLATGISLMSLVLAINLLGDRLRDHWDVKRA